MKQSKYTRPDESTLKRILTPLQYAVTRQNATEPPFENKLWSEQRPGIYVDIATGQPLFISSDKFDSGCGWPSFSRPITNNAVTLLGDTSHGMHRVEVRSSDGENHLGHLFPDGPTEKGGLRYCINSASLRFIPVNEMAAAGYADYLTLIK